MRTQTVGLQNMVLRLRILAQEISLIVLVGPLTMIIFKDSSNWTLFSRFFTFRKV